MKKVLIFLLTATLCLGGCAASGPLQNNQGYTSRFQTESVIMLSDEAVTVNGEAVGSEGEVFVSRDVVYYEDKETYPSGNPYGEGGADDRHTEEEANAHTVLNITESGSYRVSGTLSAGQIRVDLGEKAKKDPNAVVELILDNANITCTVAPAVLFLNVYECDGERTEENATASVDTSSSGAILVLENGSKNNISGSYVEKIFKDTAEEKKLWKQDGAVYSYMSMNIEGGGTMLLHGANEGLGSERHLTINGGNLHIVSQNDGINTNEDGVSVTTINGGNVNILAGLGEEGDGIDSNGFLVINGGTVTASANPRADSGLDSDLGTFINGGKVVALGSAMNQPESDSKQVTMQLQFLSARPHSGVIVIKNKNGEPVFSYEPTEESAGLNRNYSSAILSCGEFKEGEEYSLYIDNVQQGYYSSERAGHGMRPGGVIPQKPDGERPMPKAGKHPSQTNGEKPAMPENAPGRMPEGARASMQGQMHFDGAEIKTAFVMQNRVNFFSGVTECK